jgi:hypothetical protein
MEPYFEKGKIGLVYCSFLVPISPRGWIIGITFVWSIAHSYWEGCNFLTMVVSTPANCLAHSFLFQ